MPSEAFVTIENASKRFGHRPGVEALRDVSLSLPRGEVCAVVGANGAGKSTLLGLVLGFLQPTRGTVRIDGMSPREHNRTGHVACVPERFSMPPHWRVRDAIAGFAALDRNADRPLRTAAVLEQWQLGAVAHRRAHELSRGTLQRVALAQAWLAPADLLVLDEPTEGLDPLWRLQLRDRIAERRAAGTAVLIASHDLAEIERVADRVIVLEAGTVREILPARTTTGAGTYRIQIVHGHEHAAAAFPGSVQEGDVCVLAVADAHELAARLQAFLAAGGVISSVQPIPLEERIGTTYGTP